MTKKVNLISSFSARRLFVYSISALMVTAIASHQSYADVQSFIDALRGSSGPSNRSNDAANNLLIQNALKYIAEENKQKALEEQIDKIESDLDFYRDAKAGMSVKNKSLNKRIFKSSEQKLIDSKIEGLTALLKRRKLMQLTPNAANALREVEKEYAALERRMGNDPAKVEEELDRIIEKRQQSQSRLGAGRDRGGYYQDDRRYGNNRRRGYDPEYDFDDGRGSSRGGSGGRFNYDQGAYDQLTRLSGHSDPVISQNAKNALEFERLAHNETDPNRAHEMRRQAINSSRAASEAARAISSGDPESKIFWEDQGKSIAKKAEKVKAAVGNSPASSASVGGDLKDLLGVGSQPADSKKSKSAPAAATAAAPAPGSPASSATSPKSSAAGSGREVQVSLKDIKRKLKDVLSQNPNTIENNKEKQKDIANKGLNLYLQEMRNDRDLMKGGIIEKRLDAIQKKAVAGKKPTDEKTLEYWQARRAKYDGKKDEEERKKWAEAEVKVNALEKEVASLEKKKLKIASSNADIINLKNKQIEELVNLDNNRRQLDLVKLHVDDTFKKDSRGKSKSELKDLKSDLTAGTTNYAQDLAKIEAVKGKSLATLGGNALLAYETARQNLETARKELVELEFKKLALEKEKQFLNGLKAQAQTALDNVAADSSETKKEKKQRLKDEIATLDARLAVLKGSSTAKGEIQAAHDAAKAKMEEIDGKPAVPGGAAAVKGLAEEFKDAANKAHTDGHLALNLKDFEKEQAKVTYVENLISSRKKGSEATLDASVMTIIEEMEEIHHYLKNLAGNRDTPNPINREENTPMNEGEARKRIGELDEKLAKKFSKNDRIIKDRLGLTYKGYDENKGVGIYSDTAK